MRDLVADHLARGLPGQLRVDSPHDFERFLRATALRTGRLLNKAELAREVGIAGSTAAIWLDTLVDAGIVSLLPPARPAQGRGLVRAPKLYFLDTGLCCHLLGIRSADELVASPHAPAVWETCVHGEVRRQAALTSPAAEPAFWRDRTKEADFVIPTPRGLVILDAAWSEFPATADIRRLLRIREAIGPEKVAATAIVCRTPTRQTLREPSGPVVETIGIDDIPALLR
jgi:predicted AAA+ superfamily ATPase